MTRAEAIERAASLQDGKYTCDNLALHRRIAETAYDAALIAGLERAVRVIGARGTVEEAQYGLMIAKSLIRAEITRLKGAKAK